MMFVNKILVLFIIKLTKKFLFCTLVRPFNCTSLSLLQFSFYFFNRHLFELLCSARLSFKVCYFLQIRRNRLDRFDSQECSGSDEEASPARDFPTSRSDNYPSFNPGIFPPGAVSSQFLPRHTFIPPPGSFPPPYLHTGGRDFPPLARAMFPPPTVPREIFSQPSIVVSPVERESVSPFTQSQ